MSFAQFYLENEMRQRISLGALSDVKLTNVSGLGMGVKPSYADLGKGFFSLVNTENEPQGSIVGDILFTENSYQTFRAVINWANAARELRFVYCPYGTEEYYRLVTLKTLEKGVRGRWGQLKCGIALQCLTPWYLPTALTLNFAAHNGTMMRYPYRYTSDLIYGTDGAEAYTVSIPARGHVPGTLYLSYTGAASNLLVRLTGAVSGKELGRCAVDGVTPEGSRFELNSDPRGSYVRLNGADWLEHVDINHDPFLRVPNDEECILSLEADTALTGTVSAEVVYYFRAV